MYKYKESAGTYKPYMIAVHLFSRFGEDKMYFLVFLPRRDGGNYNQGLQTSKSTPPTSGNKNTKIQKYKKTKIQEYKSKKNKIQQYNHNQGLRNCKSTLPTTTKIQKYREQQSKKIQKKLSKSTKYNDIIKTRGCRIVNPPWLPVATQIPKIQKYQIQSTTTQIQRN